MIFLLPTAYTLTLYGKVVIAHDGERQVWTTRPVARNHFRRKYDGFKTPATATAMTNVKGHDHEFKKKTIYVQTNNPQNVI